jgi:[acyl-carrier-protein] S-malonyltransferase
MRRDGVATGRLDPVPLLLLCPGQGAQRPGMLGPWLDQPGVADLVARWSSAADLDLRELGTTAPAEVLRRTEVAQPLLTAAALLSGRALLGDRSPGAVCGHSVGELPALALAGVLADEDAVRLAAGRGRLMAEAAAQRPTGMLALLGTAVEPEEAAAGGLEIATVNVPGQVVLGGPVEALDAWAARPGVRGRRLDVAGAFHTSAMAPAVPGFADLVAGLTPADAVCDVIANADGARLRNGRTLVARLVDQLTRPVRFDLCLQAAADASDAVELAPAGVLAPMAKRVLPGLAVRPVREPADLLVTA